MKAIPLAVAFDVASGIALAQGAADPMTHLRACSLLASAERLECLDKLSRSLDMSDRAKGTDNWIISETTSPVDYSPIISATVVSRGGSGVPMQLSIHCRSGRTELGVTGTAISNAVTYTLTYRINDGQPVQLQAASPSFGPGAAIKGDVVRLVQSLPDEGGIAIRLSAPGGASQDGYFPLGGLKAVRDKMALVCKWPGVTARPRNE
jgi:hypothetical protein